MQDNQSSSDRQTALVALRAAVARLERGPVAAQATGLSICPTIDRALPGQGLTRAAFHEVLAVDRRAAIGFCALLPARAAGSVVWVGPAPDIWPAGLAEFGLSQADLICVDAKRAKDGLWGFEEALRSPGVAGAVLVLDAPGTSLYAGQALADAQAMYPELVLRPADDEADVAFLKRLALWAVRFTPPRRC